MLDSLLNTWDIVQSICELDLNPSTLNRNIIIYTNIKHSALVLDLLTLEGNLFYNE